MNLNRNIIPRTLSFLLALSAFGFALESHAQFLFATNNGSLTITGYTGTASAVVIPAITNGYPVIGIGTQAFVGGNFSSVTIPNSITTIGDLAFYACVSVTHFDLPASVTNISPSAFNFCYTVTNFNVDATNPAYSSLGGVLMDKARQLLVQYPAGSSATNYDIPNTVARIGNTAFYYCLNLHGVTIPNSVTNIGTGGFFATLYLSSVSIPDSVITIGDTAFASCEHMTNATIGNHVTAIGNMAFNDCQGLASPVFIPDSVLNLGSNSFDQCVSLPGINIGSGVTNIGINAFEFCSKLTNITVNPSNAVYSSLGGVLFDKAQTNLLQFPAGLSAANYVVPGSVTRIGGHAFEKATKLFAITFDAALNAIGDYAFNGCYQLPDLTIPDDVISIGGEAFDGCLSIHSLSLGANLASIGEGAFYGCIQLTGVTIPNSVTNIGSQAFGNCSSLAGITVSASNPAYSSTNGILFNKTMTTILQYPESVRGTFSIPTNVNNIGDYSFATCGITGITIPNSVTNIGNFAFYRDAITNLVLPNSVINIGGEAFAYTGLTNLIVPDSVVNIGVDAFENCVNLTNVMIGSGLITLGADAFYGCHALVSAYFAGNAPANDGTAFFQDTKATVYYQSGTSGWGLAYGGVPAVVNPAAPPILQLHPAGFASGQFAINLVGASNSVVIVQATTNLANPTWVAIGTNILSAAGLGTFQDVQATNYPQRFYRGTSQ